MLVLPTCITKKNLLYEKTLNIISIKIITKDAGQFHVVTNQLFILIHKKSRETILYLQELQTNICVMFLPQKMRVVMHK